MEGSLTFFPRLAESSDKTKLTFEVEKEQKPNPNVCVSTCMVLLLVRVITKFLHSQCCSTTWAKMTCPLPQAPASWVPSADQATLNTLPVLGFSNA